MPGIPDPPSPAQDSPFPAPSAAAAAPGATRRGVLVGGALALGAAALGTLTATEARADTAPRGGSSMSDPFTLGVASGDPLPDSVILWTRLAPDPLAEDGLGGMPDKPVDVQWQLAADERVRDVVASGAVRARPDRAHSVHVEAGGLRPGAQYFYRFRAEGEISPVGRTKT